MEICMLSELFYPFMLGGAERRYYEIAKRLAKRHDVTVYSLRFYGHPRRETVDGINIVRVGAEHPLNRRRIPPLWTYFPAFLRAAGSGCDIIDSNQGIASFAGAIKPLTRKPVVATFHDIYWNQWNDYFPFPFSSIGKTMEFAWSHLPYSRIMTVSPMTAKKLKYLGFNSPIEIIPSGVDIASIDKTTAEREECTVVFVGRLVPYKHVDALIREFRKVQDVHKKAKLRIVGTGPEEKKLKALAKFLGVNAEFLGFVSEEEKNRIIKSSTVLVNPSTVEGLGLILIESMACGTPVIARRLETYFFCNNGNSMLYENDSEIGEKILEVVNNKRVFMKLSKGGKETAKSYSWDNVAEKVEKLYRSVMQ